MIYKDLDVNKVTNTAIVACRTISDELNLAMSETNCKYPVFWIDSGLHNNVETLKGRLQKEIDQLSDFKQILLAFGYCGNSVLGITAPSSRIIIPRVDDCITLMLGSFQMRKDIPGETGTYYMTKGWFDYENNIWNDYRNLVERLGKAEADEVYSMLLQNYNQLAVVDTGAYNLDDLMGRAQAAANELNLKLKIIPGTLRFIKKLLSGPWDDEFIIINPGETIKLKHIYSN